jgi:hypothetical protein
MNSMNRKMFANRDARNKLAGMGGILSSSPELMNATQSFEPGGVVNPSAASPIATVGNRNFFLSQDGRSIVDGEGRTVRDPSVLRAIMQQDQGATAPVANPAPEPRGIMGTIGSLMTSNDDDKRDILSPPAIPDPGMNEDPASIDGPFRNIPRFNSDSLQGAVDRAQNDGFDPAQFAGSSLEQTEDPQGFFGTIGSLMTADDAAKAEILSPFVNEDGTLNSASDEGPAPETVDAAAPEQGAFSLPMGPNLMDAPAPSTPDGAAEALQQSVLEAQEASAPVAPEVASDPPASDPPASDPPPTGIDTERLGADIDSDPANAGFTASTAVLGSAGVDTSGMGIKERTVAMRDMLNDLMGQTDEDEKEEFWMNMAMVGFGIASGESSSAMKNIADGLLAGTAQISKGNADKKGRADKFTLTAFGEVLADQRAQEKFARDRTLAEIRASGSGEGYGSLKHPITQMYQTAATLWNDGGGDYLTYGDALDAARTQVGVDYGLNMGEGSSARAEMPVVTTQAEYDALPVGTQFTQNGETRRKT